MHRSLNCRLTLLLATLLVLAGLAGGQKRDVILLHVADTHGRIEGQGRGDAASGGWARLATVAERIRRENKDSTVVLIHAGDIFSRGDKLTRRTLGAANVELLNAIGFAYWTPGNGEFYDGLENLQARIRQFAGKALTANVHLAGTEKPLGVQTDVLEVGDLKIGLFGLCFVREHSRKGLKVSEAEAVKAALKSLAAAEVDAVVGVTHIGLDKDLTLAASTPAIDVIIGGHTHSLLKTGRLIPNIGGKKTLVAHAGDYLRFLGRIDLTFTRTDGAWKLSDARAAVIALDKDVAPDPAIVKRIAEMSRPGWQPPRPKDAQQDKAHSEH